RRASRRRARPPRAGDALRPSAGRFQSHPSHLPRPGRRLPCAGRIMKSEEKMDVLTSLEIDKLEGLNTELDLFRFSLRDFIKTLSGARETSVRYQVNERLKCVVLDSISP